MYIQQNSSFGLWGTFGTLFFAFFGTLFLQYVLFFRLSKNHPKGFDVRDCIAIACLASVLFVSGTIAYMLGLSIAVVLGPLATMVTTIVDYLFRYPLIVTVLFISPKVGTYALFSATTWLLSGFSTGSFGLMDVILDWALGPGAHESGPTFYGLGPQENEISAIESIPRM